MEFYASGPGTRPSLTQTLAGEVGECLMKARSTAKADGLDEARALHRVRYRRAKHNPSRRFHALYNKAARSDVLSRAWDEVRANESTFPSWANPANSGRSAFPRSATG
jgi:hypothetical protein